MTERWTDKQLDRFASSVDRAISELSQIQLRIMQEFSEYRRDMTEMRADIRETGNIQTQILQRID